MAADIPAANPMRLLVLASRPSDYTEMSELARALGARGHWTLLLYFYSPTDPGSVPIISSIATLTQAANISARAIDIDDVQRGQARHGEEPVAGPHQRSQAAEVGLYKLVIAFRDRVLGRDFAVRLGRRLPTIRRIFPVIYKIARLVDVVRNLPEGIRLSWQAASQAFAFSRDWPLRVRVRAMFTGPKVIADAAFMEHVYRQFLAFFADTIAAARIQAVLIPEDIVGNLWPVAIKAGHDAGVPTLVLPYTLANKEEAFQSLKDQPSYQTDRNEIAAILYPRWRIAERGADLVRLPSSHIFAHQRLGIAPPDPWMMNSGFADRICVDSQAAFEYFRAGGIPAEQMRVVGSVSQDAMASRRQARATHLQQLRTDLKLSGDKPLLLISGCPNQLAAAVPYCEFKTIGDVAAHVGSSVAPLAAHYHLVVRPHPNFPEFAAMLEPFGVAATMQPTFSLVPLADVFIAFASATIRWAIACGVPTVNYDVFHYGYGDFAGAKGVASVDRGDEFERIVRAMAPGSARLQTLAAAARDDSAQWSMMDGGSLYRIEEEITRAGQARIKVAS